MGLMDQNQVSVLYMKVHKEPFSRSLLGAYEQYTVPSGKWVMAGILLLGREYFLLPRVRVTV